MKTRAGELQSFKPRYRYLLLASIIGAALTSAVLVMQAAPGDDPVCKIVLAAVAKLGQTPNHLYTTMTGEFSGGKTQESESVTTGGIIYIKVHDKWTVSPITAKQMAEQKQENIRNAEVYRCQYERDENVNGEAAAIYKAHSESDAGISDAEVWISKARGLPLRETIDLDSGKSHMTVRFDYSNVQAPAVK